MSKLTPEEIADGWISTDSMTKKELEKEFKKVGLTSKKPSILGRILCTLGMHDDYFYERHNGYWRPHFVCKRCNHWTE